MRDSMTMRVTAVSLAVLLGSGGCSWAFMTKPPKKVVAPNFPVECTSGKAAPVLDSICAGYFILNAAALAGAKTCSSTGGTDCYDASTKSSGTALSIGLAALCGIAAVTGYGTASRCAEMKAQNVGCMTGDGQACKALAPDWRPGSTSQPAIQFPLQPPAPAPAAPAP